jgi:hypothetical protein
MKILKIVTLILVVTVAILVFTAPLGPLPGIFIGGAQTPLPAAWQDTRAIHEIRLEVGEGLIPRVVIIWVVQVDGDLHVVGAKESGWTSAIGNGGPVRMRMGGETYDMQATLVTKAWQPILEAYVEKYQADYPSIVEDFPPIEEAEGTISVFRLTAPEAA